MITGNDLLRRIESLPEPFNSQASFAREAGISPVILNQIIKNPQKRVLWEVGNAILTTLSRLEKREEREESEGEMEKRNSANSKVA